MSFIARHLAPKIGTEIEASRASLLSGEHAAELRNLLEARGVLVFRGVHLTDEEQKQFAGTLGEVLGQGDEGIQKISLDKELNPTADYLRGAFYWHIDGSNDKVPTRASFLSAKRLPESGGGDTQFANTYAAYEALSDDEKEAFGKLKVKHSLESSQLYITPEPSLAELQRWRTHPSQVHPLVWTHQSGRKSLVLGATADYVVDMSIEEGRSLLFRLRDEATKPENIYTHQWTPGDTIIWDNTGTMHRVMHYALDSGRMMHRTTLAGEEPLA